MTHSLPSTVNRPPHELYEKRVAKYSNFPCKLFDERLITENEHLTVQLLIQELVKEAYRRRPI